MIDFCYSIDGGDTWSTNAQVNDDTGSNDHFLPRMAVDPTTGIIGFSWLDCRNDQGGNSMVITKTFTRKITLPSFMVTNLIITPTNAEANDPTVTTSWTDNNGGRGTNLTVMISGNNITGTLVTNDALDNIYIYGGTNTNFVISAQGTSTNFTANFTIIITDNYPNAFTSGTANQSAIAYATISLDGGLTFPAESGSDFSHASHKPSGNRFFIGDLRIGRPYWMGPLYGARRVRREFFPRVAGQFGHYNE